jgi:hypothetical protein
MLRTRLVRPWVWVLCLVSAASAFASSEAQFAHKTVVNASIMRTMMSIEFDQQQVSLQAAGALTINDLSGGNSLLAISGTGAPVANVLGVELGEVLSTTMNLSRIPTLESDLVTVDEPAIIHGVRVVGAAVSPVIATENGLRAVRRVDYEVVTVGGSSVNEIAIPKPIHWAFEPVLRQMVDNLDALNPEVALDAPARYLIMGSTSLLSEGGDLGLEGIATYENWLELKRRKGYQLQITDLAQIAEMYGDSSDAQVKNFVRDTYNDPNLAPLVYAVILGDVGANGAFPTILHCNPEHNAESSVGDNDMFAVDGDDYIADVLHGRISATSKPRYLSYFRKVLFYEEEPYLEDTSWLRSVSCIAGNFSDGSGLYPVTPVWNMNWGREYAMNSGCITDADTFYYHGWSNESATEWTQAIIADINSGVCAVWYRGWAAQQVWWYPVVNFDMVDQLDVGRKYPAVWGIVCGSGDFAFDGGPCLGEKFITLGTASDPDGAIVFFGASDVHTNTKHNNAMFAAMLEGMQYENIRSTGALSLAGKLEVYRQYPLERFDNVGVCPSTVHFYGFHVFNVLGDPEVPLMYCEPKEFNVTPPATLSQGESYLNVTVTDATSGQPVPNAVVCARPTTVTMSSWTHLTDESGHASVPVNLVGASTVELSVWKHSYILQESEIAVAQLPRDPWIGTAQFTAGDDNNPNPGEAIQISFDIVNRGTQAATWSITATAADDWSTVTNGSATTPEIAPGASAFSSPISLTVGNNLWNGAQPVLNVSFDDGQGSVTRQFHYAVFAPDPQILELIVQDGDGILSPGETGNISVRVKNLSTTNAASLTATVHSFDNAISFPDDYLDWLNVNFDQEVTSTTTFSASIPGGVTVGRQIALRLVFSWNDVPFTWKQVILTAGAVTPNVPTGPDGYGYYAYEDIDGDYAATPDYAWTEIDPSFGGSGATAHIVLDDSLQVVQLPQPFMYYGQSYNQISVCSNGWFSFGEATIPEFRNWEIPSPIGPPAMVCPFWDDLISTQDFFAPNDHLEFPIYTKSDGNRFIIQWRTLNNAGLISETTPNEDFCTFQAVLEYPASGDGSILFLYNQIANTGDGNNYATVGIQDELHINGLGLTFANTYLPSVAPLAPNRAIRITTARPDAFLGADDPVGVIPTEFAMHPAYPNPFNPTTELRFDLAQGGVTTLKIYDTLGREVATLIDGNMNAGTHVARFDAATLGSGLYFARLVSGANTAVQKLVLMK